MNHYKDPNIKQPVYWKNQCVIFFVAQLTRKPPTCKVAAFLFSSANFLSGLGEAESWDRPPPPPKKKQTTAANVRNPMEIMGNCCYSKWEVCICLFPWACYLKHCGFYIAILDCLTFFEDMRFDMSPLRISWDSARTHASSQRVSTYW